MRLPGDVYDRRTVLLATLNTYESRALIPFSLSNGREA